MTAEPVWPALARRLEAWPAGPKLLALMLLGSVLLLIRVPDILAIAAAIGLGLGWLALGLDRVRAAFPRALVVAVAALVLVTLYLEGAAAALAAGFRLAALVLFAQLVTATTRASAVQDALVAGLRPFERLPFVSAEKAGLTLAVTLRALPRLGQAVQDIRQAQAARGVSASPLRLVIPLVARILRDAREIADAIDARSWAARPRTPSR